VLQLLLQCFQIDPYYIAKFILLLNPVLVLLPALCEVFLERLFVSDPVYLKSLLSLLHILHYLVYFDFCQSVSRYEVSLFLPVGSRNQGPKPEVTDDFNVNLVFLDDTLKPQSILSNSWPYHTLNLGDLVFRNELQNVRSHFSPKSPSFLEKHQHPPFDSDHNQP